MMPNPGISVTKVANPTSLEEPGGNVTFTITVANTGNETVTINSFTDSDFDLATLCPTAIGTVLPAGSQPFTCQFVVNLAGVATGPAHENTASVQATSASGAVLAVNDSASVTFVSVVPPAFTVTKVPNPTSMPEPGGNVTFTITVTNTGPGAMRIIQFTDSDFNLATHCPTAVNTVLQPASSPFVCSFVQSVTGSPATPHMNTVSVRAENVANTALTTLQTAQATVTFQGVPVPSFNRAACPGSNAMSMQAGAVSGTDFDVVVQVNDIDDFFGAGFHVTFNPTLLSFLDFDDTGSILQGSTEFLAEGIGSGEIAVTATLVGSGAGIPNASGALITLSFRALQENAGTPLAFDPPAFRIVKVCPTAGQVCNEIQGSLTWCGGTVVID
jgi:hypothetical protein